MARFRERRAEMVWHILGKDWKLTWVFVLIVALVHWIDAVIRHKIGLFDEDPMLEMLLDVVPVLALFGSMFLIGAIVHLDAIPGVRQDWLVRPISRRDLVLEKFLFIVLMVNGPIFIGVLCQGIANGFSFRASLAAAMWQVAFLFFALILPIFSFASVTRDMTQAFIFGCGCAFLIVTFQFAAGYLNLLVHGTLESITWSGIGWVGETARFALAAAAACAILGLQYYRRKTPLSRGMVLLFGFAILATQFLPWKPAFAIQRKLSTKPDTGRTAAIVFDAALGKFRSPSGLGSTAEHPIRFDREDHRSVFLPLRVTGIHTDAFLLTDRVEIRLVDAAGKTTFHGVGEEIEVTNEGPKPVEASAYQEIRVPASVYREIKDQPIQVEVGYSLTLFGLSHSYSMRALGGDERMPRFGWCQTKMNDTETAVELRCMQPGKRPTCATLFLESERTSQRNPERSSCEGDYSPYSGWFTGDNMAHFGTNLPFRDPSGLSKFPVDGPELPNSRVVIRVYEPEDHFTRSLVISQIKLQDWEGL
jgi:ABC-type transport system involved in multi-copper enzyme maturation permease subunit